MCSMDLVSVLGEDLKQHLQQLQGEEGSPRTLHIRGLRRKAAPVLGRSSLVAREKVKLVLRSVLTRGDGQ